MLNFILCSSVSQDKYAKPSLRDEGTVVSTYSLTRCPLTCLQVGKKKRKQTHFQVTPTLSFS